MWPELSMFVSPQEHFFMSKEHFHQGIQEIMDGKMSVVDVLAKSPYSVFSSSCGWQAFFFDSHARLVYHEGMYGPLISVPSALGGAASAACYLISFFDCCLQFPFVRQADLTLFSL